MILVDSSAMYALGDDRDSNHTQATDLLARAERVGETLMVHNYLLVEAAALLQRRFGLDAALTLLRDTAASFEIHWVTPEDHQQAVEHLAEQGRRRLSLVDTTSFVIMRKLGVRQYMGFDSDFEREGFTPFIG